MAPGPAIGPSGSLLTTKSNTLIERATATTSPTRTALYNGRVAVSQRATDTNGAVASDQRFSDDDEEEGKTEDDDEEEGKTEDDDEKEGGESLLGGVSKIPTSHKEEGGGDGGEFAGL